MRKGLSQSWKKEEHWHFREEAEEEFEAARAAEYEEQTESCRELTADEDSTHEDDPLDAAEESGEPSIDEEEAYA